jgi:hypothetical protein
MKEGRKMGSLASMTVAGKERGRGKRAAGKLTDEAIIAHPHGLGHVKLWNRTRLGGALLAENLSTRLGQTHRPQHVTTPRNDVWLLPFFSVLAVICTGEVIKRCRNTCGSMPETTTSCGIGSNLHAENRRPRVFD